MHVQTPVFSFCLCVFFRRRKQGSQNAEKMKSKPLFDALIVAAVAAAIGGGKAFGVVVVVVVDAAAAGDFDRLVTADFKFDVEVLFLLGAIVPGVGVFSFVSAFSGGNVNATFAFCCKVFVKSSRISGSLSHENSSSASLWEMNFLTIAKSDYNVIWHCFSSLFGETKTRLTQKNGRKK